MGHDFLRLYAGIGLLAPGAHREAVLVVQDQVVVLEGAGQLVFVAVYHNHVDRAVGDRGVRGPPVKSISTLVVVLANLSY